jgi:hypothetical protein
MAKMSKTTITSTELDLLEVAYRAVKEGRGNEVAWPCGADENAETWTAWIERLFWRMREQMKDKNGRVHA